MHAIVTVVLNMLRRKANYDRDNKRLTRVYYKSFKDSCKCVNANDRSTFIGCSSKKIKDKLIGDSSYFYNPSRYIINISNKNQLTVDVWNSRVTKLSYKTELCKMTSHFKLLTRKFL